jgi:hypothetical protein
MEPLEVLSLEIVVANLSSVLSWTFYGEIQPKPEKVR